MGGRPFLLLAGLQTAGCSFQSDIAAWNLKSVKNDRYVYRILKAPVFFRLKTALAVSGYSLVLRPKIDNEPLGALSSLYGDGLSYDLSNQDTSTKMSDEMRSLSERLMPYEPRNPVLYLEAQLDMTHSQIRVDAGSIRTELRYTLRKAPNSSEPASPQKKGDPIEDSPAIYQQSTQIQATFDGSRMSYEVLIPSKPLSEMERFEVILSDLSNRAMEVMLTDPDLATIIATLSGVKAKIDSSSEAEGASLAFERTR